MAAQNNALNIAANAIADAVVKVSLHTTDGSTSGSGELTGGTYAKINTDTSKWGNASGGVCALSGTLVFNGPGGSSAVTHLGFWATGDVWLGSAKLSATKTIGPGDTLTITAAPISVAAVPDA